MIYEIQTNGGAVLATLPGGGQSPHLAALRKTYDLSLQCAGPISLWRMAFGGDVREICRIHNGELLPITEA